MLQGIIVGTVSLEPDMEVVGVVERGALRVTLGEVSPRRLSNPRTALA
jgi:hypothetical protein